MSADLVFFIQARMGSSRLPGKVLRPFSDGSTIIDRVTASVRSSRHATGSNVVFLTTTNPADDEIVRTCAALGTAVFRGSELDVLDRFAAASAVYPSSLVVRICCDNPFLLPVFIDELIDAALKNTGYDYYSHGTAEGVPVIQTSFGLFSELFPREALLRASERAFDPMDREHVTRIFYTQPSVFRSKFIPVPAVLSEDAFRFTIDTAEDFNNADTVIRSLANAPLSLNSLLQSVTEHPSVSASMKKNISMNKKR